jgi:PASTA domain
MREFTDRRIGAISSARPGSPTGRDAVTGRATRRYGVLVAGLMLALAAVPLAAAPLTETGRRAYEAAQKADDEAAAAFEEGEKTFALLKALAPERDAVPPGLKPFLDEGEAARQALQGYRRLTQAGATDALRLLADVSKLPTVPAPDLVRRDTLEQHAVLAAHEAAVMSARTRTETERLRAILAEARLATAESGGAGRGTRGAPAGGSTGEAPPSTTRRGDAVVPNLIGARLDAATRDLETAGLRLGPVTGPRDGFIVKQSPDAGAGVPRQSVVTVTLSGTAATIAPAPTTP